MTDNEHAPAQPEREAPASAASVDEIALPRWAVEDALKHLENIGRLREQFIPIGLINLLKSLLASRASETP